MGKTYHKKTYRSRRKLQKLQGQAVTVELADGKACFQMILPMSEMLFDVAHAIEQTASHAGPLMVKAMIDEEVEQLPGPGTHISRTVRPFAGAVTRAMSSSPDAKWPWKSPGSVRWTAKRFP